MGQARGNERGGVTRLRQRRRGRSAARREPFQSTRLNTVYLSQRLPPVRATTRHNVRHRSRLCLAVLTTPPSRDARTGSLKSVSNCARIWPACNRPRREFFTAPPDRFGIPGSI